MKECSLPLRPANQNADMPPKGVFPQKQSMTLLARSIAHSFSSNRL